MTQLVQDVLSAISVGSLYALFALGIALVFGIGNVVNFAHGAIIMVSSYGLFFLLGGMSVPLVIVATVVIAILVAVVMELTLFRPVRTAHASTLFMVSFGASQLLRSVIDLSAGETPRSVSFAADLNEPLGLGTVTVTRLDVVTLVVTGTLLGFGALFLRRSEFGLRLRAAAEDFGMARLLGVRANAVMSGVFAMSGLLAGVSAVLLIARTGSLTPGLGDQPVLIAFVATVLGGLGSLSGAVIGGFVLGGLTVALQVGLPTDLQGYQDAFLYGAVIVLLLLWPQGLLPHRAAGKQI